MGYSRWELHLGNLIRSKLCSVDSIRILLNFFKLFIATVGWVAGNLCLLCFIGREYACTYASSFYLLRTIFVGSFGVQRIRWSFNYVVDPTVRKMMCVVAMYDDVSKTCAEMEDFVWNFSHRVVRGESRLFHRVSFGVLSPFYSLFPFCLFFVFFLFFCIFCRFIESLLANRVAVTR